MHDTASLVIIRVHNRTRTSVIFEILERKTERDRETLEINNHAGIRLRRKRGYIHPRSQEKKSEKARP